MSISPCVITVQGLTQNVTRKMFIRLSAVEWLPENYQHFCTDVSSIAKIVRLSPEQVENEIRSDYTLLKGVSDPRTNSHHFWEMWLLAVLNNLSIGCNCFCQIGRESSRTKLIRPIWRQRYKPGGKGAESARKSQVRLSGNHDNTIPQSPPNSIPNSITRVVIKNSQWHPAPSHLQNAPSADIISVRRCCTVSNC